MGIPQGLIHHRHTIEVCLYFPGDGLQMFFSLSLISGWEEKGAWRGYEHEPLLPCEEDAPQAVAQGKTTVEELSCLKSDML